MPKRLLVIIGIVFVLGVFFGTNTKYVRAVEYQVCKENSSCVVGDFLRNDDYSPVNSNASCSLNSRKPDGSVFLNSVTMSIGTSDGWYYYNVNTANQDNGVYPTEMCCTIGVGTTEYMCNDKTFRIDAGNVSASEVANSVWSNSTRNLTDFGSMPESISDIKTIVTSIQTKVNSLDSKVDGIDGQLDTLLSKWDSYSINDVLLKITGVGTSLGTNADTCSSNTVFGNIACVKDKWGSQTAESLYTAANGALTNINNLRSEVNYNGKSYTAYDDVQTIKTFINTINGAIGTSDDLATATTLFGKIKGNKDEILVVKQTLTELGGKIDSLTDKIDDINSTVATILNKWSTYSIGDVVSKLTTIETNFGANDDICGETSVFGTIACVKDVWGDKTANDLYSVANNALNIGTSIRAELDYFGKSQSVYDDIQTLKGYVDTLETKVGTSSDASSEATLFGKLKSNKEDIAGVPTNVWGYANRTLTSFGSLVADIWSYTTRSLTGFGTLVSDVWSNSVRTLTHSTLNSGNIATDESVESSLSTVVSSIKGLDNKDLSQVSIGISTAQNSINTISTQITSLSNKLTNVETRVDVLISKWGDYSAWDVLSGINSLSVDIGATGDNCTTQTVFGNIACVKDKWGSQTAESLYTAANGALTNINNLRSEVNYNGRSTTAFEDLQNIKNYVTTLNTNIGSSNDIASSGTLFGKLKSNSDGIVALNSDMTTVKFNLNEITSKLNNLDTQVSLVNTNTASILSKWNTYSITDILNRISGIGTSLGTNVDTCSTNTIFGNIACVKDKWGSQTAESLYTAANGALNIGTSIRAELNYNGKSTTAYDEMQTLKNYVDTLETNIGNSSDTSAMATIFGKLKSNNEGIAQISGQVAGVQSDIDSVLTKISNLGIQVSNVNTDVKQLLNSWANLSIDELGNEIASLGDVLGLSNDTCTTNTVFGSIACVKDKWGDKTANGLYTVTNNAITAIGQLTSELNFNGKSTTAYEELNTIKNNLSQLQLVTGTSDDAITTTTLFGKIKKIQATIDVLNGSEVEVGNTIDKWGTLSATDIYNKVKDLSSQISSVNTISNVDSILSLSKTNKEDLDSLKNQLLSMQALIDVNKTLLEKSVNQPIIKTWLEEGSIIFKTMITNPSTSRQKVPLKFYLPKEAKEKDIMKVDTGVAVKYDTTTESLFIEGEFDLLPKETKVVSVEIDDVWKISETEIDSVKNQAEELTKPLNGTSYFAQGVTLKSDINANLENIKRIQNEAVTPEARIQAYRENTIKLNQVKGEMKDLQTLVSSLSSTTSLTGFVGGAQTVSLWGIILTIGIGVVLMTTYMRVMIIKNNQRTVVFDRNKMGKKRENNIFKSICKNKWIRIIFLGSIVIIVSVVIISNGYKIVKTEPRDEKDGTASILKVKEENLKQIAKTDESTKVLGETTDKKEVAKELILERIIVVPPEDSSLKIRKEANLGSEILGKVWVKQKVDKYEEENDWTLIGIKIKIDNKEEYIKGWIRNQFVEK